MILAITWNLKPETWNLKPPVKKSAILLSRNRKTPSLTLLHLRDEPTLTLR